MYVGDATKRHKIVGTFTAVDDHGDGIDASIMVLAYDEACEYGHDLAEDDLVVADDAGVIVCMRHAEDAVREVIAG